MNAASQVGPVVVDIVGPRLAPDHDQRAACDIRKLRHNDWSHVTILVEVRVKVEWQAFRWVVRQVTQVIRIGSHLSCVNIEELSVTLSRIFEHVTDTALNDICNCSPLPGT